MLRVSPFQPHLHVDGAVPITEDGAGADQAIRAYALELVCQPTRWTCTHTANTNQTPSRNFFSGLWMAAKAANCKLVVVWQPCDRGRYWRL